MSADLTAGTGSSDVLDETLGRLSKKAGVKATLLLDRASGAILKMEGQTAAIRTAVGSRNNSNNSNKVDSSTSTSAGASSFADEVPSGAGGDGGPVDETQGARELAGLVWNYVKTSGELVGAIDTDDELKLLRLRTKKQELVIVPDPKYLLIVVHDTPPA